MSAPEKLNLFSFDSDQVAEEETVSEEQLESVRAVAFEAGREAALADLLASEERRLCELCETLLTDTAIIAGDIDRVCDEISKDALGIAMNAVGKVLPTLVEANAVDEIEGLVKNCLTELRAEPRVVIRLHAQTLDAFKSRLERIAGTTGYEGKLVLFTDDDLSPSDCKVLWADGGALRDAEETAKTVTAAVQRYLGTNDPKTEETPQNDTTEDEQAPIEPTVPTTNLR